MYYLLVPRLLVTESRTLTPAPPKFHRHPTPAKGGVEPERHDREKSDLGTTAEELVDVARNMCTVHRSLTERGMGPETAKETANRLGAGLPSADVRAW